MKINSKAMAISLLKEKNSKNQIKTPRTLQEPSYIPFGIGKGAGTLNVHNSSSTARNVKFSLPSAATDSSPE